MTSDEIRQRLLEIKTRLEELSEDWQGRAMVTEAKDEWNSLVGERGELNVALEETERREEYVRSLADDPAHRESTEPELDVGGIGQFHTRRPGAIRSEDVWDLSTIRTSASDPSEGANELKERALRATDISKFPTVDKNRAESRIEGLLDRLAAEEDGSKLRILSRQIIQTGSPTYKRAFFKKILGRPLNDAETRSLGIGSSSAGILTPFQLDPTIIPTSNYTVNSIRQISRVVDLVGTNEWKAVTSGAITANRRAEGATASDNAPSLTQPAATASRVDAFVPFSTELGQDWPELEVEIGSLLAEAKDEEEGGMTASGGFISGSGTLPNPQGILTAGSAISTATTGTFVVGDLYSTQAALPARFRSRAVWLSSLARYNSVRQFDTSGGAQIWTESLRVGVDAPPGEGGSTGYALLGRPAYETSGTAFASGTAAATNIAVFGDFSRFVVLDRIGMSVRLIPDLFAGTAASFSLPVGMSGLFAFWRNGSKVIDTNAFRVLQFK